MCSLPATLTRHWVALCLGRLFIILSHYKAFHPWRLLTVPLPRPQSYSFNLPLLSWVFLLLQATWHHSLIRTPGSSPQTLGMESFARCSSAGYRMSRAVWDPKIRAVSSTFSGLRFCSGRRSSPNLNPDVLNLTMPWWRQWVLSWAEGPWFA